MEFRRVLFRSGFPYRPATGPPRRSHGPACPDSRTSGLILGLGGTLALVGLYRTGVVRGLDHSLAFACPGAFRNRLRLGRLGGFLVGRFAGARFGRLFRHLGRIALGLSLRSEEHTSELQSLMRISYAVFCLKKKNNKTTTHKHKQQKTYLQKHKTQPS